jgi:hypothetical protein
MTTYYKATRPDGTDFYTGKVDYAAALASGEVIRHPGERVKDDAATYLSVSIAAADCTGAQWPCRLFRVEPVGRATKASDLPNKRCVSALRVVQELPAHLSLGPNGEAVAAFIAGCAAMNKADWGKVIAAWAAAWAAAWDAARAITVRDLITAEQYDLLTQPFVDAGFAGMVGR